MNSNNRIAATLYSLGTVCPRNISINTLHKGDDDDDDDDDDNNNITKYKSSCMEIQRMWNLKCKMIAVTIGATGMVTKALKKSLEAIPVQ